MEQLTITMRELPLDVRILIGAKDFEAFMLLYKYDTEFKKYTNDRRLPYDIKVMVSKDKREYSIDNIAFDLYDDGYRYWYKNGVLHNICGPAVVLKDGFKIYYIDGVPHRAGTPQYPSIPIRQDMKKTFGINPSPDGVRCYVKMLGLI
jgi:hypothetical protein